MIPTVLRLGTSPGYPQLITGMPMGFPTGMETCGSESPVITGLHGSGSLLWCCILAMSTCKIIFLLGTHISPSFFLLK